MAPWTHVALKVSGLVGVLLMVYVVLVPRGTLERLAAEGGGGVVSTDTTQHWTSSMRLQCCTCSASVPAWEDDFLVLDDSAPQAVEGGGKEAISVEDALYAQQRVEKKNIEHARSNYMLDTNAVCDGSSCAAQRPAHDAGGAATHPTSNREPLVLTGSTDSPDIPATATSFTPPPFTIILGLHHKTGTALVDGIYSSIAEYLGMLTVKAHYPDLARQKSYTQDEVLNAHIVSDWHLGCHLPEWFGGACASITDKFPRYRMVHIVRDPVEVVISGYLYHKHGPMDEAWLRRPDERYNGLSYYNYLHSMSEVDGIKAEVENAIWEINMYATAYTVAAGDNHAINIRLEDFSADFNGTAARMLLFTGLDVEDHPEFLSKAVFWDISRWNPKWRDSEHLTATYKNVDRTALRSIFATDPELNGTFTNLRRIMGY